MMRHIFATTVKGACFAAVIAASGAAWAATDANDETIPVTLRPTVTVDHDKILLGDVFRGVEEQADRPIARAPAPGQNMTLKATWLWRIANTFEVDWKPSSRLDTTTVYRNSVQIGPDRIFKTVRSKLHEEITDLGLFEVELDSQLTTIHLASGTAPSLALTNLQMDSSGGHFTAKIVAPAEGQRQSIVPISGRVHQLAEVAVPNRRIRPGDIITESDLHFVEMRSNRLTRNQLVVPEDIVGLSAKRVLAAGRPVSHSDIEPPKLVSRKGMVTVFLETPVMRLTTQAKALESGAKGDVIKVKNLKSGKLVDVIVTGANQAAVVSSLQQAMR